MSKKYSDMWKDELVKAADDNWNNKEELEKILFYLRKKDFLSCDYLTECDNIAQRIKYDLW